MGRDGSVTVGVLYRRRTRPPDHWRTVCGSRTTTPKVRPLFCARVREARERNDYIASTGPKCALTLRSTRTRVPRPRFAGRWHAPVTLTVRVRLVSAASFTIRFPEHVARERVQQCLTQLEDAGATIVLLGAHDYRLDVDKSRSVSDVGGWLYHSYMKHICSVVGTSGAAEPRAGAYPKS